MARPGCVLVKAEDKTNELRDIARRGRVEKFEVNVGWGNDLCIYVLYGKAGGDRAAVDMTERILQIVKEDNAQSH